MKSKQYIEPFQQNYSKDTNLKAQETQAAVVQEWNLI